YRHRDQKQQSGREAFDDDGLAGHAHHSAREFSTDDWIGINVALTISECPSPSPFPAAVIFVTVPAKCRASGVGYYID
ncbi:MAG TPA: hypothetical protein VJB18_07885, partial [Burkholderiales bacterium]|nr:hypothetical protein [Burkholderiales bacterium]